MWVKKNYLHYKKLIVNVMKGYLTQFKMMGDIYPVISSAEKIQDWQKQ